MTTNTTIGAHLRHLRTVANLTQREAAERIGMDFTLLSKVEAHRMPCSPVLCDRLVRLYGLGQEETDHLYALAGHVPPDVLGALASAPGLFDLVRAAAGLSTSEIRFLTDAARELASCDGPEEVGGAKKCE